MRRCVASSGDRLIMPGWRIDWVRSHQDSWRTWWCWNEIFMRLTQWKSTRLGYSERWWEGNGCTAFSSGSGLEACFSDDSNSILTAGRRQHLAETDKQASGIGCAIPLQFCRARGQSPGCRTRWSDELASTDSRVQ